MAKIVRDDRYLQAYKLAESQQREVKHPFQRDMLELAKTALGSLYQVRWSGLEEDSLSASLEFFSQNGWYGGVTFLPCGCVLPAGSTPCGKERVCDKHTETGE